MSSIIVSLIVLACVFGGALLGVVLRSALPPQHLNAETKDVVKLGTGLVGTIAALVLGLLIASAKGSYDAQSNELTQLSANIALIDRILAHYGPTPRKRAPRSCAILVILELYTPFEGLIQISSPPLDSAIAHLGQ